MIIEPESAASPEVKGPLFPAALLKIGPQNGSVSMRGASPLYPVWPLQLLRRLDAVEEGFDLAPEIVGMTRQLLRRAQHLARRRSGLAGALLHVADAAGHRFRTACRLLHVAGDLGGGRALLLHGGGN